MPEPDIAFVFELLISELNTSIVAPEPILIAGLVSPPIIVLSKMNVPLVVNEKPAEPAGEETCVY